MYELKISPEYYGELIDALKERLTNQYGILIIDVHFKDNTMGETKINNAFRALGFEIELNRQYNEIPRRFGEPKSLMPDYVFLNNIFALFHETRHCEQQNKIAHEETSFGKDMAYSIISEYKNPDFCDSYYYEILLEIDANCSALLDVYSYLNDIFGAELSPKNIDKIFLNFVNEKAEKERNFILHDAKHYPYTSIDDIKKDIDAVYERFQNKRDAFYVFDKYNSKDVLAVVGNFRPDVLDCVENSHSMREICKKAASVMCRLIPTLQSKFHSLDNVDLSMQTILGLELSDKDVADILEEIKNRGVKTLNDLEKEDLNEQDNAKNLDNEELGNVDDGPEL